MENKDKKNDGKRGDGHVACMLIRAPWIYRNHLGIALLRLCVGSMILLHGVPKLILLFQGQGPGWMDPLGLGGTFSLVLCVFAEFVCGLAVLVGFLTRLAALVLVMNFWVIVFVVDSGTTPMQAETPLLYLICFATLVCTGGGRWSLDSVIHRHYHCHEEEAPGTV